jgi:hypothetical protein
MQDLWLPEGGRYIRTTPLGRNQETGGTIVSKQMEVHYTDTFGVKHKQKIVVMADEFTSDAEIEDQMGYAAENYIRDAKQKYNKRPATYAEMKEAGKAIDDFRMHRDRRAESTNNKLYY